MDNIALIVITILAVIFVIPFLYMQISAVRSVGTSVPVEKLPAAVNTILDRAVYCYFMSASCSMCKSMTPVIENLQSDNPNIVIIDINKNPSLAKDFHVFGTPTIMAIQNGFIKKVKLGKLSVKKLEQFITD